MTTLMVELPFAFAAGVKVSVPLFVNAGATEKRLGFVDVMVKLVVCALSFDGPGLMLVAHPACEYAPESSATVTFDPEKDGGSLTGATLIRTTMGVPDSSPLA